MSDVDIDVIILGAGPAGLAAATACDASGLAAVTLEGGRDLFSRDRSDGVQIAGGVGGAGLFSDGKFSFYPSATQLWTLQPRANLQTAYEWAKSLLENNGVSSPPFPTSEYQEHEPELSGFFHKIYDSTYMSLDDRKNLIDRLAYALKDLRSSTHIIDLEIDASFVTVNTNAGKLRSSAAIFATGRLGPLLFKRVLPPDLLRFHRLEVGVRLEQPSGKFFLHRDAMPDPKLIWHDLPNRREWRTFCCCRDGEIVPVLIESTISASGRADLPATGRSSIGFHARIYDEDQASKAWTELERGINGLQAPVTETLPSFIKGDPSASRVSAVLGPSISDAIREGLGRLMKEFSGPWAETLIHAPTIEGVMYYPTLDDGLRLDQFPVWVAGDATGRFRGLTAALVSGYFAGIRVSRYFQATP